MGLHQTKKLLHSERNYQQNQKAACWMGEDICKQYISLMGVNIQNLQRSHITYPKNQTTQLKNRQSKATILQ